MTCRSSAHTIVQMTFQKCDENMLVRPKVMEKRLKLARKLEIENGGKLPNPWKMIQQGHGGLYRYIQRHPTEFSQFTIEEAVGKEQIEENRRGNFNISIREEHFKNAQQLARKNNGVLQDISWLMQHGHTRLASYMKTYPHVFVNLEEVPKSKVKRLNRKTRRY